MKILFYIGHPAHVHYFKNLIRNLKENGHAILVSAIDKEVTLSLLQYYKIKYILIGRNLNGFIGKIWSLIRNDIKLLKVALSYKPDLFVSTNLPFPSHVGFLMRKPVIGFTDTERASINHLITNPFTDIICTPSCFQKDFGKKHIRFNSYMELCYLHPEYFTPNPSILNILGINKGEKYVILRFVSWNASHDIGHTGLTLEVKRKAVKEMSKHAKVFISSEGELPDDLKKYQIKIPPEKMHDALAYASLLYGESATMASECACLGIPSIYIDNVGRGYTDEEENKYCLVYNYTESLEDQEKSIKKGIEILQNPNMKQEWQKRRQIILSEKIDVTAFMVWFIENYPESERIMKRNADYQYNFR